ncbi:hypothetical protein [Actinomadura sp. WMMA1423]|uniref:hypothetical protein n=1 Tax=Actinomadura sp. WMMA1423 TaxID=2591108 RepID=UPI00114737FE|nr:hypothetical protein [Actinomadura sp. WMMA1423]
MADESTIAWRLAQIENAVRDLGNRVVPMDLYSRDRAEIERDIAELRAQLAEEKLARKEADRDLKAEITGQGSNWRQAIYAGVIPGALFLVGILLQLKGGK